MSIGSGVFDPWGSKNRGFPLTRRVALTTVLHYRADCDISYLAPFPSYGSLLVKFSLATVDGLTLTPSLGVIPANFAIIFTSPETRMISLPSSENRMIVASFVWTNHRYVTDGQTDGRTDRPDHD